MESGMSNPAFVAGGTQRPRLRGHVAAQIAPLALERGLHCWFRRKPP